MKFRKLVTICLLAFALMVTIVACQPGGDRVVIGTKNFTEQVVLGEILAQQIESKTKLKVERRFNLNGTFVCFNAIRSGQLDLYPEYSGTAYTTILKQPATGDAKKVFETTKERFKQEFQRVWSKPFGFNNAFAMVIRGADARKLKLETLSQASKQTPNWQAGFGFEFLNREDGFPALSKTYNLKFREQPKVMDLGLLYRALLDKQVDFVAGNATDGVLSSADLTVLEDDKRFFPPYEAAAIVRQETLQKHPELQGVLDELGGKISAETMRKLNYRVDVNKEDVKQVAQAFLQGKA